MAAPRKKNEGIDLLYPDLLSKDGLLHNLRKRYIKISSTDLETLDKESLVDLYNKYILPMPQRKYRDNRRGRDMKRKQIIKDKKRKFTLPDDGDSVSPKKKEMSLPQDSCFGPNSGLVNHFTSSPGTSRLKPPPSCIDTSKKVVKLSSSTSPSSSISSSKQQESDSGSSLKPSKTVVKPNGEEKSNDTAVKRPANDVETDEESPKKKFKAIKWP